MFVAPQEEASEETRRGWVPTKGSCGQRLTLALAPVGKEVAEMGDSGYDVVESCIPNVFACSL